VLANALSSLQDYTLMIYSLEDIALHCFKIVTLPFSFEDKELKGVCFCSGSADSIVAVSVCKWSKCCLLFRAALSLLRVLKSAWKFLYECCDACLKRDHYFCYILYCIIVFKAVIECNVLRDLVIVLDPSKLQAYHDLLNYSLGLPNAYTQ